MGIGPSRPIDKPTPTSGFPLSMAVADESLSVDLAQFFGTSLR
jgi:hypothetical protein